jgi:hypothetical protein
MYGAHRELVGYLWDPFHLPLSGFVMPVHVYSIIRVCRGEPLSSSQKFLLLALRAQGMVIKPLVYHVVLSPADDSLQAPPIFRRLLEGEL